MSRLPMPYQFPTSIILSISFGYAIDHDKLDPLVNLADEVLAEASIAFNPGSWIVDFIPFCKHTKTKFQCTPVPDNLLS